MALLMKATELLSGLVKLNLSSLSLSYFVLKLLSLASHFNR